MGLLFAHPSEEFYLSQIGEILGKPPGYFQRGINALEREGMLCSTRRGNQRVFALNKSYPLLNEIRSIVGKTVGVEGMLRDLVDSLPEMPCALIYGSYAKDTLRPGSDIDVLLVVTKRNIEDEVIGRLSAIEQRIQREVNYTMYTVGEFRRKRAAKDPFLDEILNGEFILLKGEPRWILSST